MIFQKTVSRKLALIPSLSDKTNMELYFVWKVCRSMLASGLGRVLALLRDERKEFLTLPSQSEIIFIPTICQISIFTHCLFVQTRVLVLTMRETSLFFSHL